jgi:hypothetical protein
MQVSNAQSVDLILNSDKNQVHQREEVRCAVMITEDATGSSLKKLFAQYQKASDAAIFVAEQKDRC